MLATLGTALCGGLALSAQVGPAAQPAAPAQAAAAPAAPKKSQWDGVYTLAQAQRGYNVFDKKCGYCHLQSEGEDLGGGPQDSVTIAPPLVGPHFTVSWNNKSLERLADLIHTTQPKSEPGTLSRREAVDALACMLEEGGYQAGKVELPREGNNLNDVVFLEIGRAHV